MHIEDAKKVHLNNRNTSHLEFDRLEKYLLRDDSDIIEILNIIYYKNAEEDDENPVFIMEKLEYKPYFHNSRPVIIKE